MKYLCLIYDEEKKVGAMSQSESAAFMGEYFAFTEGIRKIPSARLGSIEVRPVMTFAKP
jgi:hypothetical protein